MIHDAHEVKQLRHRFWTEKKRHHKLLEPVSLVAPDEDTTVLFNVAGMQPLVPYLSGKKHPLGTRLYNIQKCLRTNDIEEIGDERHLSLFEMMGNRSLGDYFKKEALTWSVAFLVDELGLDMERLGCSIFGGYVSDEGEELIPYDAEAEQILLSLGIAPERIKSIPMREGEKCDNFWGPAGAIGPCGPSAEFHYDRGEERGPADRAIGENDRFIEIWNNVFMEFYKEADGSFRQLSQQNVDTGMGFERLMMVLHEAETIFETDVFIPLIRQIEAFTSVVYPPLSVVESEQSPQQIAVTRSYRIVLDHIRAATFLIADGVRPSNDAKGYVLRRLIRRMTLHLSVQLSDRRDVQLVILSLVRQIRDDYDETYNSLGRMSADEIASQIVDEMQKFFSTLEKGKHQLTKMMKRATDQVISGEDAFLLYDTFGFPLELTQELAAESDYTVDIVGYDAALQHARTQAQAAATFSRDIDWAQYLEGVPTTEFVGYDDLEIEDPRIIKQFTLDDGRLVMIFDRTPFYAEGGGQTGDRGVVQFDDGTQQCITDVIQYGGVYLHMVG